VRKYISSSYDYAFKKGCYCEFMEKKVRPGNPNILEASKATRWPALSPGEKAEYLNIRIASSVVRRLEALAEANGGSKSQHARDAIEEYLEKLGY
jgi:Ribbon-helix-helix protein, copG family